MKRRAIYAILIFALGMGSLFFSPKVVGFPSKAEKINTKEKTRLPTAFQKKIDSLQEKDKLDSWLNAWYVYLSDTPAAHYKELTLPIKRIWRKPKTTDEQIAWFYVLILSGYYELQQGDILKSTNIYEKAYQFVQRTKAIKDDEILEYLIKPLGNNYTRLGDYERAFYIQKEGLKRAQRIGDRMQEAAMLANMSTTARWNDHLKKAVELTREGLKKVKNGTPLQGLLYSTQADILQEIGQLKNAGGAIKKALKILSVSSFESENNKTYWYAGALMTAGAVAQKKNHFQVANNYYHQAFYIYRKYFPQSKHREKMKVWVALGQVSLLDHKKEKALHCFNRALAGLITAFEGSWPADSLLYSENTLLDALKGKAEVLHLKGEDRLALKGYQKTMVVLQKLRETIFSREAKRLLQTQSLQTTEDGIALAYHLFKGTGKEKYGKIALQMTEEHKARLLFDELQKNVIYSKINQKDSLFIKQKRLKQAISYYTHAYVKASLLHQKKDSLQWKQRIDKSEYQLSMINQKITAQYPTLQWNNRIDVTGMMKHLPDSTTVWEYFAGSGKWFAFSLNRKGIQQFTFLGQADSLHSQVAQFVSHWFKGGAKAMVNDPGEYTQQAFKLYNQIKMEWSDHTARLLIIPDGALGMLPFDALITDKKIHLNPARWSYLLWKAITSQSYSLAVWDQLQNHFQRETYSKSFSGFFINPDEKSHLASLEGVKKEEKQIKENIRGSFYKEGKATSERLLQAVNEDEVIHISTHSFLLGEKQIPALQMEDKKLLLADLYPLQAHPALIVMSACQTADGLLSPGEGVISLAREFTAVGAGGVIAALWKINDETAAALTAMFYKKLQKSGNKAAALYQTKKAWLTDPHKEAVLKLPYYWAGMVYYGNNVPLSQPLRAPFDWSFWGWFIAGGCFILLLFFFLRRRKS